MSPMPLGPNGSPSPQEVVVMIAAAVLASVLLVGLARAIVMWKL